MIVNGVSKVGLKREGGSVVTPAIPQGSQYGVLSQ